MSKTILSRDLIPCLLCYDPLCSKSCKKNLDPAKTIRSLRFSNYIGALIPLTDACINCDAPCEKSCVSDNKVRIKDILTKCYQEKVRLNETYNKVSLKTDICGIPVENPFLLSSSVVASNYDMCKRAFEAGWAGVAFKTISLIDIHEASPRFSAIKNIDGSFSAFKNIEQLSDHSVVENLEI